MSHLDHIVRVKERLSELGVTCPFEQRKLIDNAFKEALLAYHFTVNPTFVLVEKELNQMRCQLDRWNNVSPIGHEWIYSNTISSINLLFGSLRSVGRANSPSIALETEAAGSVWLEQEQCYKDLVAYLFQEAKKNHE